jgi:gluconolactonase
MMPPMEIVASGYQLAEAPVAVDDGGVVFSDVLGGGVHRWSPATGSVETVVPKRRGIGGMARHADGGLVLSGREVIHVLGDATRTIYAPSAESGVTGLNDLTVDPDGRLVVGQLRFRPFAGEPPVPGEFVTVSDGAAAEVVGEVLWANGCAFAPDGTTFYGCDYQRGVVLAADRRPDGTYGPARIAVTSPSGAADGLAVDETGALWVALGPGGVGRFTPDGRLDRALDVPASFVASLCFGGADGTDLFITTADNTRDPSAGGVVLRTAAGVAGCPITPATA